MHNIVLYPGLSEFLFTAFGKKVSAMTEKWKLCAVVMDEMAIKETVMYNTEKDEIEGVEDLGHIGCTQYIANHAIVFMVRALLSKWKQPVAYYFSSGPMKAETMKMLFECIAKLAGIGLHVLLVICDQGSNNRSLFETKLHVTTEQPYFAMSEMKIFILYDPQHLVKNVRNLLKKHGFQAGDKHVVGSYSRVLPSRLEPAYSYGTKTNIQTCRFATIRSTKSEVSNRSSEPFCCSRHNYHV